MAQEVTIDEVIDCYSNLFVDAYADLVSLTADKPSQVLIEIENFNSHLIVFLRKNGTPEEKQDNLKKAKGHLQRGALDCYKLLFVEINNRIRDFVRDLSVEDVAFALGDGHNEKLKKWHDFSQLIREARKKEIKNIGSQQIADTIATYKNAVDHGFELYQSLGDSQAKLASVRKHLFFHSWKAHWPLHLLEIVGVVVLTLIVQKVARFV